jgi:hypothetical protein
MHKKDILFFLMAFIIISCGNNSSKEEKPVEKTTAPPPVYKMDMLEKIFNNDNWMKTAGKDTSYYYFSRIPSEIQIHQYRIVKGDSMIIDMSAIRFSNDSLVWRFNDSTWLFLAGITNETSAWDRISKDLPASFYVGFEKKDEKQIKVTVENNKSFILTRTLPLSTFLIRSRYDYLHGTNYAFRDTVFSTGRRK